MTGEEMEIITGNSHTDQVEDIDIDLNYTSGQMDDDMILGDYDETAAEQHASPEAGDEQMAEGDDASYGMVDADEIDYDVTDPANDPDTEIGGIDDNSWQLETVAMVPEPSVALPAADEVDFAIVTDANEVEVQDATEAGAEEAWLEGPTTSAADVPSADAQVSSVLEAQIEPSNAIETASGNVDATDVPKGNSSPAISNNLLDTADGSAAPQEQITQEPNEYDEPQEEPQEELQEEPQKEHEEKSQEGYEEDYHEEQHEEYLEEYREGSEEPNKEFDEDNQDQEGQETAVSEVIGVNATGNGQGPSTDQQLLGLDETSQEDHVEEGQAAHEWSGEDLGKPDEAQAGLDFHENAALPEQQISSQNHEDALVAQSSSARASSASVEDDNVAESKTVGPLPHPQITASEDPSAIAARYDIVVQYGDSDYQLFAKSTEDDPNRYFLSDRTTLDLPLAGFLSSIREVIAQELSPLDELVMSIDGLGFEFAETTTRDFIERYTFGDMLVLYDNLASNDDADFKPDIHIVLQVRPNCSQRLAALVDQANSGRGLSDVAIYRESPRLDDDFDEDFDEYEVDEVDETLATTPAPENSEYHDDVDDEADNDQQSAEQKADEHTVNDDQHRHSDFQEVDGQPADIAEIPEEDGVTVAKTDDSLLNDDVDFGPSKQDQPDSNETRSHHPDAHDAVPFAQNGQGSDASSHNTSATLHGDDQDEIDYSEDDDDGDNKDSANNTVPDKAVSQETAAPIQSPTIADDEITWESEDEETGGVAITTPPKTSAQVSPATGKRARSTSNASDDEAPPSAKPRLS